MTRLSFEDHLGEDVTAEPLPCDGCGKSTPVWALYEGQGNELEGWICGHCIQDVARVVAEQEAAANTIPDTSWESELGKFYKAERIRLLREYSWTVDATSPFGEAGKALWMEWVRTLNRMTVDSTPDQWTWPSFPPQQYD